MKQPCDRCPCPATCLRWDAFCALAAKEPPDPVALNHIRQRSAQGPAIAPLPEGLPAGYLDRLPPLGGCCS